MENSNKPQQDDGEVDVVFKRSKAKVRGSSLEEEAELESKQQAKHGAKEVINHEQPRHVDDASGEQVVAKQDSLPMAPVNVKPDLDHRTEKQPLLSSPDTPAKVKVLESESDAHLTIEETGDSLPDLVFIPFETAVKDVVLEGWEDDWISHGTFDDKKWKLEEPKIDFVYLWVNGSDRAFQQTKRPFEEKSVLNDEKGEWINSDRKSVV